MKVELTVRTKIKIESTVFYKNHLSNDIYLTRNKSRNNSGINLLICFIFRYYGSLSIFLFYFYSIIS